MIDLRNTRHSGPLTRAEILRSVSALALLVGGITLATPASAQSFPGSARCPIVTDVVTCTGDLTTGFRSLNDARMRELIFRDLTGPMTGTTAPGLAAPTATAMVRDSRRTG